LKVSLSEESLRYSIALASPLLFWAAARYFLAARMLSAGMRL
jgi:hypothetical protein